jgi:hypothetical protein
MIVALLIFISDIYTYLTNVITSFFTVIIDPFDYSNTLIKFQGRNIYYGFKVIESTDEFNKRAVSWFYRNVEVPSLTDWNNLIIYFKLEYVPMHVLQVYDINKNPLNKFIIIHSINKNNIIYSLKEEPFALKTITLPTVVSNLLPEKYILNMHLKSKY